MPRSDHRYDQTVIGDCGHLCSGWPQVTGIGGTNPTVICDECTRARYGIAEDEEIAVWVRVKEEKAKPVKKKAKPRPVHIPQSSIWDRFM